MSYGVGDTGYMGQVNNTAFLERQLAENSSRRADNTSLDFEDMLLLLVTQLQNQSIDNQMDASDMMNQLIQMTVMQSLTEVTMKVEEQTQASVMTYAASLVGKEVTVGVVDENGKIQEVYGEVTATGMYDGEQVIFMGENCYSLNSILAVGKLPEKKPDEGEGEDGVPGVDGDGNVTDPDGDGSVTDPDGSGNVTDPDGGTSGGTDSAGDQNGAEEDV